MRKPSRMIVAIVLAAGLAAVGGCGSKTPAPAGNDPGPDKQPDAQPNADAKPAAVQATYELDPAKHAIPAGPVAGVLAGEAVTADVRLEGHTLLLRKPASATPSTGEPWQMWIELPAEAQRGEPYKVVATPEKNPGVSIFVELPKPVLLKEWSFFSFEAWEPTARFLWKDQFSLTLELGKREKGRIAGKVYVALSELECKDPAQRKSYLAGAFEVECPRQPTDPPTAEDVPLVNGSVTLRGAPANATLRVGYGGAAPTQSTLPLGGTEIQLGGGESARWNQASIDPPRVTSLIAGDGKNVPSRYEHSKLTPGRYLVFAQIKDGPAAWKWVTVREQSTMAADLTIDAAQVGGVEVTTPLGVLGKVQMVPAEEPGQPAISPETFLTISLQMNLERDIIVNKALFKNLAPGKYEVRAGNRSRTVEIVAGKTLELDLDKSEPVEPKK